MTCLVALWLLFGQLSAEQFWQQAPRAQVVYLGEHHDRAADHRAQLALMERLQPDAIGFEMFSRPLQPYLDDPHADLVQFWDWGIPWQMYAPLWEYGRAHGARLLALNAPREAVHRVAQGGSLPADLPDPPDGPDAYRESLKAVWAHHHGPPDGFAAFFRAQCLWDETMAEGLDRYLTTHPSDRVAVIVGAGHVEYGYGIPQRLARRRPGVVQLKVLFEPSPPGAADFVYGP